LARIFAKEISRQGLDTFTAAENIHQLTGLDPISTTEKFRRKGRET
jgi:hypothetical protein